MMRLMRYHDAEPYLVRMEAENGLNYSLAHPTNGPSFADPRPHYFDSSGRAHFYTAEQYEAAYLKAHWEQVKISGYAGMNMYFGLLGAARGAAFTPQPTPARSYSQTALYTASRSPYTPCPDTLLRRVDLLVCCPQAVSSDPSAARTSCQWPLRPSTWLNSLS